MMQYDCRAMAMRPYDVQVTLPSVDVSFIKSL